MPYSADNFVVRQCTKWRVSMLKDMKSYNHLQPGQKELNAWLNSMGMRLFAFVISLMKNAAFSFKPWKL